MDSTTEPTAPTDTVPEDDGIEITEGERLFTQEELDRIVVKGKAQVRRQYEKREKELLASFETQKTALVAEVARLTRDMLKGNP